MHLRGVSDNHQRQPGSDAPEIGGVAGHDGLPGPLGTNDDMGIDDVCRRSSCQQEADSRCVRSVERDKVGAGLANETAEAGLPGRVTNGLGQCRRWDCDPHAALCGAREECEYLATVSIQCDQPASVESDAAHAAFPLLEPFFCAWGERSASAQARSSFVSGPPVWCSASSSISLQPAASKRATPTAWFTKAETLAAFPAATSARISSTWSSGSVMVILVVAIPKTIPCERSNSECRRFRIL